MNEVFLVEDEAQQRELLCMALEAEGFTVRGFESAEEAYQRLTETVPALLITDVKLTGVDGFTLFEKIKANPSLVNLPVIFITAYNDPPSIERIKQVGATGYVTKPYNLDELITFVKNVLQ